MDKGIEVIMVATILVLLVASIGFAFRGQFKGFLSFFGGESKQSKCNYLENKYQNSGDCQTYVKSAKDLGCSWAESASCGSSSGGSTSEAKKRCRNLPGGTWCSSCNACATANSCETKCKLKNSIK